MEADSAQAAIVASGRSFAEDVATAHRTSASIVRISSLRPVSGHAKRTEADPTTAPGQPERRPNHCILQVPYLIRRGPNMKKRLIRLAALAAGLTIAASGCSLDSATQSYDTADTL